MPERLPVVSTSPFRLPGDRRGLLCIHGFTGSPFEMRMLAEAMAARGYTASGPRLAGHDPAARALGRSRWPDWLASVEEAFDELRAGCDVVGVCGLSLGGLLALELARRRPSQVGAIAVLAAPLFLSPRSTRGIRALLRVPLLRDVPLPKLAGSDVADPAMRRANPALPGGMPLAPLGSLLDLGDHLRPRLGEIRTPALVAHAVHDHVVPAGCADAIAAGLAGPVERLTLTRSFHVVTIDVEREDLFRRIGDFFDANLSPAAPQGGPA